MGQGFPGKCCHCLFRLSSILMQLCLGTAIHENSSSAGLWSFSCSLTDSVLPSFQAKFKFRVQLKESGFSFIFRDIIVQWRIPSWSPFHHCNEILPHRINMFNIWIIPSISSWMDSLSSLAWNLRQKFHTHTQSSPYVQNLGCGDIPQSDIRS